jgi:TPR repeat protein/GTPase SAR1 family protein
MNLKKTISLIILLSQTTSLWGMKVTPDPIEDLYSSIQMAVRKTSESLDYTRDANKVIVIGDTGRGKTSLIHYLAGKNLTVIPDGRSYFLNVEPQDLLPGFEPIGTTINAGTTLASSWYDLETNIVYWDCPGFGDPGGPEKEIVNAFSIHQLFKRDTPTKLILVASESDAKVRPGRSKEFLKLLERVSKVLPERSSYRSVSSVITQQRDREPQDLLQEIFNDLSNSQDHEFRVGPVKDLLEEIITPQNRISAFPEPKQEGPYPSEYRSKILESINSTPPMVNPRINFVVSPEARLLVTDCAQKINNDLENSLRNDVANRLMDCCLSEVDIYSNPFKNGKELSLFLEKFKRDLESIKETDEHSLLNELRKIIYNNRKTNENFHLAKDTESLNKVKNSIESIQFLQTIDPNVQFHMDICIVALQPTLDSVTSFYYEPKKFYEEAAKRSFPNAYKALGVMYESGTWVEKDILMAIKNYKQAVNNELTPISPDLVPIQHKLGCFYTNGIADGIHTIEKNPEEAFFWFEKAAQNGHALSQYNLGLMYEKGIGISQNIPKSFEWFKKAASQNILNAFVSLGLLYQSKDKLGKSLTWFEKAGRQGHEESQYMLGRYNKAEFKYDVAFKWFVAASEKNHFLSQYELALSYLEGKGTDKDVNKALELFKNLADQDQSDGISVQASLKLGNMYLNGEEVEKSESKSVEYFTKASEKGHEGAKNILQHLSPNLGSGEQWDGRCT